MVLFSNDCCLKWHCCISRCYLQLICVGLLVCTWRNTLRSMSMNSCDIWNQTTTKIRTIYFRRLKLKLWLKLSFTTKIKYKWLQILVDYIKTETKIKWPTKNTGRQSITILNFTTMWFWTPVNIVWLAYLTQIAFGDRGPEIQIQDGSSLHLEVF